MIKKCFLFLVVCEILTANLSAGTLGIDKLFGEQCETPNGSVGFCSSLKNCYPLAKQLETYPTSEEVAAFAERSICGEKTATDPRICCGLDSHFIKTKIEAEKALIENNLHGHPSECGVVNEDSIYIGIRMHWNALLEYRKASGDLVFACGGSIITKRYILTAAHCVSGDIINSVGELVSVRLGEHNMTAVGSCLQDNCPDPVKNILVESVVAHPEFVEQIQIRRNDIALVRLSEDIQFTDFIQPLCLPYSDTKNSSYLVGAGWGITPQGKKSDSKQEIGLIKRLIKTDKCNELLKFYNTTVTDDHICIENKPTDLDACYLEDGGSLLTVSFFDNHVHSEGISSMRWNCENKTAPHVFTNVGSYIPWIIESVQP